MASNAWSMAELRSQIMSNAKFAYQGAFSDFAIITGNSTGSEGRQDSGQGTASAHDSAVDISTGFPGLLLHSLNSSARNSDSGLPNSITADRNQSRAPSIYTDISNELVDTESSTWAALMGWKGDNAEQNKVDKEQLLLKSPSCNTELESIERLHKMLKAEVSKRMSLLSDHGVRLDVLANSVETLLKIPAGFALGVDEKSGMLFVVNHINKTTQWQVPGYKDIRAVRQVVPKSEALREAAEEASRSFPPSYTASRGPVSKTGKPMESMKGAKVE